MDILIKIQVFLLDQLVPFVILLGLLIFVHELGHFLVAKFCKVRVEVFSLGFGKKIFQFTKGSTIYCISLIPLGGYVKMFGDDPTSSIPPEERAVSFSHKNVFQRIAIVLAGPLMNFAFAIVLFAGVGLNGEKTIGPQLGDIESGSAAARAGFQAGDKVIRINGQPMSTWKEVKTAIEKSFGQELRFEVERGTYRTDESATSQVISVLPQKSKNPDVLQLEEEVYDIEGLSPFSQTSTIGIANNTSPAFLAGLRSLDQIVNINNVEIKTWQDVRGFLQAQQGLNEFKIRIKREIDDAPEQTLEFVVPGLASVDELGIEPSSLYISQLSKDMPAMAAGFRRGDKVLAINDQPIEKWQQVLETVNSFKAQEGPLKFSLRRDGADLHLSVVPKENTIMTEQGQEETRHQVGIGPAIFHAVTNPVVFRTPGFFKSLTFGWQQTVDWTKTIVISFYKMLQNKVSPKNIGGIFTIGQVASETFKLGLSPYLKIMAVISINLFIINLLPIPILDGGHLVFFLLEALRGAPLSIKKMEVAQQIGMIILISLMAFALFNDISRIW